MECAACKCNTNGSKSTACNSKGQCVCKEKFYGTKCDDRDCEMTTWSEWSGKCRCGYTDTRKRNRKVRILPIGNGKPCSTVTKENTTCKMIPCNCAKIRPGYYGDRCEKRDCVWNHWSAWNTSTCKTCPGPKYPHPLVCYRRCRKRIPLTKRRTRSKKTTRVGKGKGCSGSGSEMSSCGYVCVLDCSSKDITTGALQCIYNRT